MKKFSKIIALLLALVMLVAVMPAAFATNYEVEAGKTVTVSFVVENIKGIDGTFTINDPDGIVKSYTQNPAEAGGMGGASGENSVDYYGTALTTFTQTYTVVVDSSAAAGQQCTITFNYEVTGADNQLSEWKTMTHTITVKKTTTGGGTTPTPGTKIDYSELEKQIGIAEGLNKSEYTSDSWANLEAALAAGKAALKSKSQSVVDDAAEALAAAIAALVKMDYSALLQALADVETFIANEELADLWLRLVDAFTRGQALLTSGDQAAVDACAAEINEILNLIKAALEELRTPVIEQVEVEVPVEVLPTDDYCNIPMHRVWPILFFISLALNVALVVVIIVVVSKKKKDNVPLVNHDEV